MTTRAAHSENGAATLPPMPDAFGDRLPANVALDTLTQNDIQPGADDDGDGDETAAGSAVNPADLTREEVPATPAAQSAATPAPGASEQKRGPGRPPGRGPSKRQLARMGKGELAELFLAERAKVEAAELRAAELAQDVAVRSAVSADVVDESVRDIVADVVNLADAGVQLYVGEKLAPAVELDAEETERLVTLGARVAKLRMGAKLAARSPEIALAMCAVSIAMSKVIAYRIARNERGE